MSRILIVEDNADTASLYQRVLRQQDYIIADHPETAMQLLAEKLFDLVILDLHLHSDSGMAVLEYIRLNAIDTKVFVISSDDLLRKDCESIGIEGWMTKPIEISALVEQVYGLL